MKTKKIPLRSCVITKERLPKEELVRIVRTPEHTVIVDLTNRANGRGAYLKKDLKVFEKAEKSNILSRQLEVEVPKTIYEQLRDLLK